MDKRRENHSRRKFLDKSVLAGTGLAAMGIAAFGVSRSNNEAVKMITLDGRLVEVDPRHIKKMCAGQISNSALMKLIDKEKKRSGQNNQNM